MKANEVHIFPFFSKEKRTKDEMPDLESEVISLRGMEMERIRLVSKFPFRLDGREVKNITYWHPIGQTNDIVRQGIELVENGLGYAPKLQIKCTPKAKLKK